MDDRRPSSTLLHSTESSYCLRSQGIVFLQNALLDLITNICARSHQDYGWLDLSLRALEGENVRGRAVALFYTGVWVAYDTACDE